MTFVYARSFTASDRHRKMKNFHYSPLTALSMMFISRFWWQRQYSALAMVTCFHLVMSKLDQTAHKSSTRTLLHTSLYSESVFDVPLYSNGVGTCSQCSPPWLSLSIFAVSSGHQRPYDDVVDAHSRLFLHQYHDWSLYYRRCTIADDLMRGWTQVAWCL